MMLAFLLSLGLSAHTTLAYLTPEQVLLQQQQYFGTTSDNYFTPNNRRANEQAQEDVSSRAAQHPDTFHDPNLDAAAGLTTVGSVSSQSASSTSSLLPAAPAAGTSSSSSSVSVDPVMLRLLQRLQRQNVEANTNAIIAQQKQPLTPSGPAETAVVLMVIVAIGWTVLHAWRTGKWPVFGRG